MSLQATLSSRRSRSTSPRACGGKTLAALEGSLAGKPFKPVFRQDGVKVEVTWAQPVTVKTGDSLVLNAKY